MKYEALIFDLDGTLLDTLDDLADSVNAVLSANGYPTKTRDEGCQAVGSGMKNLIGRVLPDGLNDPSFDRILNEFKAYYGAHCEDKTAPYVGIAEMLEKLRLAGVKMAIVSNKADYAVKMLSKRWFADVIPVAIGENEAAGIRKKPAPDTVDLALRELGVTRAQAAYVGDSDVDVQTALNCEMPCLSVTWGFRDREFLLAHGATELLDTPQALWDAVQ
jgi:phosphoglycolate phosphatase